MHIIVGGTGHVGSAAARALLRRGEPVTVVTRDAAHADALALAGARVAEADVRDVERLRTVLRTGTTALLLNPPAAPHTDTDKEEHATAAAICAAAAGSGLRKVVAASTFGARPGAPCGDLTVLHAFEEGLRRLPIPLAVNRAAYYYSNWAGSLATVRDTGRLSSFFPADLVLPMVAPEDLGEAAARRLLSPLSDTGIRYIEGPRRYTPADVARAFSAALGRPVEVDVVPREGWEAAYRAMGFSAPAARTYACMTGTVVDDTWPEEVERGSTTLEHYIAGLVR